MNFRRWLRPVIASVTVLAVGVGAAFVGTAFAAPETVIAEQKFESVPVLEPVGFGDEAPPMDSDGDPNTIDTSRAIGRIDVPVGNDWGLDPGIRAMLDAMAEADDPGVSADPVEIAPVEETDESAGDDCAPRDGSTPSGCPDGLHSTILPIIAPPELYVIGGANPAALEDSLSRLVYCEPQDHGARDLPYGVSTNVPATITMRYWPDSRPAEVQTVVLLTTAEVRATWEAGLAAGLPRDGLWLRPQYCTVLPDLDPYTAYTTEITAVDIFDRTATFTNRFMLPDDRTRPPTRVVPLGDSIVFASAPHIPSQSVSIRAWQVGEGAEASCASSRGGSDLPWLADIATTDVSASYLAAHRYQPAYTKRTSASFWVPEGVTIVVCITWTNPDAPSWNWRTALLQSETVLQTPDRTVARVSVEAVNLTRTMAAGSVELRARTREGEGCGIWSGPSVEGAVVPSADLVDATLCRPNLFGSFTRGTRGDIVVTSAVTQGETETFTSSMLRLNREVCYGSCVLPEPSYYDVSLATIRVGAGLCGSSFGSCDPPTRETSAGSARLRVDWEQGNLNGRSEWFISSSSEGRPDRVVPDLPQMDTFQEITATRTPGFFGYDLGFSLNTDRPVTYTATLEGDCFLPSTETEKTGSSAGAARITFARTCAGGSYWIDVELVDEAGTRAVWNVNLYPTRWAYGFITTPGQLTNLSVDYSIDRPGPDILTYLSPFSITVGTSTVGGAFSRDSSCIVGTRLVRTGQLFNDAYLGELVPITIELRMVQGFGTATGDSADCTSYDDRGPETLTLSSVVHRSELFGEGVTLTSPEGAPYDVTVTVRGY